MIGGFNKILRNFASIKGKSEFEKRLIKATYTCDMKEPKEKHVICKLICVNECLKGKHLELIRPKEALTKLFDRFFDNLKSLSLMMKALSILHRALQEVDISQMVAHKIKDKENMLYPCQKEDEKYDTKMQCFICELYIDYIKNLINFIIISQLFSINLKDLQRETKALDIKELFLVFSRIDGLIENILKIFDQKAYCLGFRLFHTIVYLLFVDLLKIYQSYYLLITVMLEKFAEMPLKDAKRAFIIYLNFIKINKEIRKMALCILQEFHINMKIVFYDVDGKLVEAMKQEIEIKENENHSQDSNSQSPPNRYIDRINKKQLQQCNKIVLNFEEKPKIQFIDAPLNDIQIDKKANSPSEVCRQLTVINPQTVGLGFARFKSQKQVKFKVDNEVEEQLQLNKEPSKSDNKKRDESLDLKLEQFLLESNNNTIIVNENFEDKKEYDNIFVFDEPEKDNKCHFIDESSIFQNTVDEQQPQTQYTIDQYQKVKEQNLILENDDDEEFLSFYD